MPADVLRYRREQKIVTGLTGSQTAPELGGGYVVVDGLEEVYMRALRVGEIQGGQIVQREAGAADDDPFGEGEKLLMLAPLSQGEEAVGSHEVEYRRLGQLGAQGDEGMDGVVGLAALSWGVDCGGLKARVGGACQLDHGEPVGEWGSGAARFQGLQSDRSK